MDIVILTIGASNIKGPRSFPINPNDLAPHIAIIAEGVSPKELAFHCERRGLCENKGVSDPTAIGVVG